MDQFVLTVTSIFLLLVLLAWAVHAELEFTPLVSGLISVSVVSIGFLATVALRTSTSLGTVQIILALGCCLAVLAGIYELTG